MFGGTPAFGLMVRHVTGIEVSDFKVITVNEDARPCFLLDDVSHADIYNLKASPKIGSPLVILNNVRDFSVERSKGLTDTKVADTNHQELR